MVAGIALAIYIHPQDPFFVESGFPWPLIAPLLASLHYGFQHGLVSAVLLVGAMELSQRMGLWNTEATLLGHALGTLILAMIVGEFRDIWARQLVRLQEANNYRQLRLDEFTRSYHLLKVSHDRLEQRLVGNSFSLREALVSMRRTIGGMPRSESLSPQVAGKILGLFAEYGNVQQASLHLTDGKKIEPECLAKLGEESKFVDDDPLLLHCLETGETTSVRPEDERQGKKYNSRYMVCVPFIDSSGRFVAVVTVKALPFFSLHVTSLRLLAVLAGHLADLVQAHRKLGQLQDTNTTKFLLNLERACHDAEHFGLDTGLAIFRCHEVDQNAQLSSIIRQLCRGLDIVHEFYDGTNPAIALLLPLTDPDGVDGFFARLGKSFEHSLGYPLNNGSIKIARCNIGSHETLSEFLQEQLVDGHPLVSRSGEPA
ncbi:PelD GGDEF domain-containing protein [Microbulbifer taiwanensis]